MSEIDPVPAPAGPPSDPPAGLSPGSPDITVLIATWNAAGTIDAAIASALAQDGVTVEVLVVDDGSSDGTPDQVAARWGNDPRVRLIRSPRNGGAAAARNLGLDHARGDWIAILDSDDRFRRGRLSTLVTVARSRGADIAADNQNVVAFENPEEEPDPEAVVSYCRTYRPGRPPHLADITARDFIDHNRFLARSFTYGYMKPVIRRTAIDRLGLRYDTSLRVAEDFHFLLDLLLDGARLIYHGEPFYDYTARPGSLTRTLTVADLEAIAAASDRTISAAGRAGRTDLAEPLRLRHHTVLLQLAHARFVARVKAGRLAEAFDLVRRQPVLVPIILRYSGHSIRWRSWRLYGLIKHALIGPPVPAPQSRT